MDRLASCYFCGVAVDAPLEEYPVVPRDLHPSVENQQTVVLCKQCRGKLSTIIDTVVEATDSPEQTHFSTEQTSPETDADVTEGNIESPEKSMIEGFNHEDEVSLTDLENAADDNSTEEQSTTPTADTSGNGKSSESVDIDLSADSSDDTTEDQTPSEIGEKAYSESSYNSVVRLLQNRSFPVDFDEIVTVASSAYRIERQETEAIIDALVEKGVIDREGDQLRHDE